MKNHITLTVILVLMAFITGFFTKDIFQAVLNIKSNIAPSSCTVGNVTYKSGEGFKGEDGCNSCSCQNGQVMCTAMACDNTTIINDEPMPDDIQLPSDNDMQDIPMPQTCMYNGRAYKEGDSFSSTDGCNTCGCSGGQVNCTLRACAQ